MCSSDLQIAGPDLDTLTQIATQVQAIGTGVNGLSPLQSNSLQASPELHLRLDRARMAQLGVTSQSVATILRTSLTGSTVSALRRPGQPQVDITIIGTAKNRASLNDLMAVPVAGGTHQLLTAAYRPERVLPVARSAFADGARAVRTALAGLAVVEVGGIPAERIDDADTPEDLRRHDGTGRPPGSTC